MTRKYNEIMNESRNFSKLMLFPMVHVTPELAENLLKLNTENRPVKKDTLNRYVTDLTAGKWQFAGDTVKISKLGVLQDGQHRLLSIVKSGISMIMHIQTGLNPEVFTVLDTGTNRSAGDVMALKGYKYHNVISTVVRYINRIYNQSPLTGNSEGKRTMRHEELLNLAATFDKGLLEEACHQASMGRMKAKFVDTGLIGALWYILAKKGRTEKVTEFLHLLSTGDGLGSTNNSSVYLLRNRLIENLTSTTKLTMDAKLYLITHCWNSFIKNKSMARLPKIKDEVLEILI